MGFGVDSNLACRGHRILGVLGVLGLGVMTVMWEFPKTGVFFLGPYNKDPSN